MYMSTYANFQTTKVVTTMTKASRTMPTTTITIMGVASALLVLLEMGVLLEVASVLSELDTTE